MPDGVHVPPKLCTYPDCPHDLHASPKMSVGFRWCHMVSMRHFRFAGFRLHPMSTWPQKCPQICHPVMSRCHRKCLQVSVCALWCPRAYFICRFQVIPQGVHVPPKMLAAVRRLVTSMCYHCLWKRSTGQKMKGWKVKKWKGNKVKKWKGGTGGKVSRWKSEQDENVEKVKGEHLKRWMVNSGTVQRWKVKWCSLKGGSLSFARKMEMVKGENN